MSKIPSSENSSSQSEYDNPTKDSGPRAWFCWLRQPNRRFGVAGQILFKSVAVGVALCFVLFVASGVWPPMTAISSSSMEPAIERGDAVFLTAEQRFTPAAAIDGTGVVTYRKGQHTGYTKFGAAGDVILYNQAGRTDVALIIHRARFWVENGENWYRKAHPLYISGAENCTELRYCPAPHAGFITKGDANGVYDQAAGISPPVRPSWIQGTAEENVPWFGYLRLIFSD